MLTDKERNCSMAELIALAAMNSFRKTQTDDELKLSLQFDYAVNDHDLDVVIRGSEILKEAMNNSYISLSQTFIVESNLN